MSRRSPKAGPSTGVDSRPELENLFQACGNFATNSGSRCDQITIAFSGGLVMRTAVSTAAPPRHLRWQAAFTIKAYQTLSPVVWHHAFVSDTHMTNWCGGSDLFLTWVSDGGADRKAETANIRGVTYHRSFRNLPV